MNLKLDEAIISYKEDLTVYLDLHTQTLQRCYKFLNNSTVTAYEWCDYE